MASFLPSACWHRGRVEAFAEWMAQNGGLIAVDDFTRYAMESREPLRTKHRGYDIVSFPPPSSGGVHELRPCRMYFVD